MGNREQERGHDQDPDQIAASAFPLDHVALHVSAQRKLLGRGLQEESPKEQEKQRQHAESTVERPAARQPAVERAFRTNAVHAEKQAR